MYDKSCTEMAENLYYKYVVIVFFTLLNGAGWHNSTYRQPNHCIKNH